VVIRDFNVVGISRAPAETDPPLLVDSDTVLPISVTPELLESVAGRDPKIFEDRGGIEHPEFPKSGPLDTRLKFLDGFTPKQALSLAVSETLDHTTY
jgi:hypothetical protein